MGTRIVAVIAGMISLLALGFALAQIMPLDRHRLPSEAQAPIAQPAAPTVAPVVREVLPAPTNQPVQPQSQPPAAAPAPAPPPATKPQATKPAGKTSGFDGRAPNAEILYDLSQLDPRIVKMREKLIEATKTGRIDRLSIVFQMNETMPTFTRGNERDPVAFWKSVSGDGQGIEILAILRNILELPPAKIHAGTAQEMVVWPYLAQVPLENLNAEQQVDLYRLVTAQDVRDMKTLGQWAFWRVGIGKDGTLHYFVAGQ